MWECICNTVLRHFAVCCVLLDHRRSTAFFDTVHVQGSINVLGKVSFIQRTAFPMLCREADMFFFRSPEPRELSQWKANVKPSLVALV